MGSTVHIEREAATSLRLVNSTGVALVADEFTIMAGRGLVAVEAIAISAEGGLQIAEGCKIQAADFVSGSEDTFATVGQAVYWDPTTKKFSDTSTATYYLVGHLIAAIASGVIDFFACAPILVSDSVVNLAAALTAHVDDTADAHDASAISILDSGTRITGTNVETALAEIVGAGRTTETIKGNAAAIIDLTARGGIPFTKIATLTSALATTPVDILTDAEVGAGNKAIITDVDASVGGTAVWAGTGTVVIIRDKADSEVTQVSFAKAQLGSQAQLGKHSTGVTLSTAVRTGAGATTAKGLELVADGTFETTGSDLTVIVSGIIVAA